MASWFPIVGSNGVILVLFSEKDVYVGYLPLAHVLELIAGNVYKRINSVYSIIVHQIFLLAHDWSKRFT